MYMLNDNLHLLNQTCLQCLYSVVDELIPLPCRYMNENKTGRVVKEMTKS